jgi:acyl-CoA synthetase (NDP forming)/GNAT superfamily N-acetyltransferase
VSATTAPSTTTRALLPDGSAVALRELTADDSAALVELHRQLPLDDRYLRFFGGGTGDPAVLARSVLSEEEGYAAVGAFRNDRMIGVAHCVPLDRPAVAEVALVVAHDEQSRGVGTLLLEHLVSLARQRGLRTLSAEVLAVNSGMLRVFTDSGLVWTITSDGSVVHVDLGLAPVDRYLDAVAGRERTADVASLRSVLAPRSVAVVGASRRTGSVGSALLRNVVAGGFTGRLHAVNPHAAEIAGVPCVPSVAELPEAPDLAVLCVPAAAVPQVARECGARGAKALLVITAGLSSDQRAALLEAVREHDLRLVGPNCLGVSNTDSAVRLDATFAARGAGAGSIGVVTQSGGVAIALLEQLGRLGLGTSQLVSTGDKYDVSGNDLLMWWAEEPRTDAVVLYLESFGNPRKFSRIARHVARTTPVLAVRAAGTEAGARAAVSHTAATATPAVVRDALFRQAGVLAVDGITDLVGALAALHRQPLPAGPRVAVVGNAGGLGVLAADACVRSGLTVAELSPRTREALARLLPASASTHDPVDTTAVVSEETFARCLDLVRADEGVDAVIAVTVPTALGDPGAACARPLDESWRGTPLLAVRAEQRTPVELRDGRVPSYAEPGAAASVLALLWERARWLARPRPGPADLRGVDVAAARAIVDAELARGPAWLAPDRVVALLRAFGLPVLGGVLAGGADPAAAAVSAQHAYDAPVALKALVDGVVHKSRSGGVRLGLQEPEDVRTAVRGFQEHFGDDLRGVFVQPMSAPGRELLIGVVGDERFGPLVVHGLGGVDTDVVNDRSAALVPLSEADADDLLHGIASAPCVLAEIGDPGVVRDVLLRVARLAEELPEVAELDLNPLIVTGGRAVVVDARVRLAPVALTDPFLRRLRT